MLDAVGSQARRDRLESRVGLRLMLVAEELFVNLVRHAQPEGIVLELAGTHLTVMDRGKPFNTLDAPSPDLDQPLPDRVEGGLGLHLVRSVASRVEYHRDGDWNRVDVWVAEGTLGPGSKRG